MAIDQLSIYNDALYHIGERKLATLSDNSPSQRVLDHWWQSGKGAIGVCLENGAWNFATRSSAFTYSPSIEPAFGFQYAFNKPTDWVRTAMFCADPFYRYPTNQYADEGGFWFANLNTIYLKYISDDLAYGNDTSLWPQSFYETIGLYLAKRACLKITSDKDKALALEQAYEIACKRADGIDGQNKPTRELPLGNWPNSRFGSRAGRPPSELI